MTKHHPDSHDLMDYSAGSLNEAHALCIRLHLDRCPHCRSRVDMLDCLGAIVMEEQASVSVSAETFECILARISDDAPAPALKKPTQDPLARLLGRPLDELPWKRQLADVSALDISHLFPGTDQQVVLQKLAAGGKAPAHTHRGEEVTVVLQGAFVDNKGVFNQWDFVTLTEHDDHKPVALNGEDCITLSVLSAPVKLTGTFTRLLNPFIH